MERAIKWMRRAVALASVLAVAALCWQCIDIYRLGNAPGNLEINGVHINAVFSPEIVAGRLSALDLPLGAYALLVLCALGMQWLYSPPTEKSIREPEHLLRLMKAHLRSLPEQALKEERLRRRITVFTALAAAACALPALGYFLNRENFTSWDLERVMGQMLLHTAPWVLLIFALLLAASHLRRQSAQREAALLKALPKNQEAEPKKSPRPLPLMLVRLGLCAAAVLFIVLGVMNGGLRDVLVKAINICTECIGLG